MKKEKLKIALIAAGVQILCAGSIGLYAGIRANKASVAGNASYAMELSSAKNKLHNDSASCSGSAILETDLGNEIGFNYVGVSGSTSGWQSIDSNGYFYNTDPIHGIYELTIYFLTEGADFDVYYSSSSTFQEESKLYFTSSLVAPTIVDLSEQEPNYIKIVNTSSTGLGVVSIDVEFDCSNK